MRQIEGRMRQAREKRDGIKIKKTHELGIWLSGGRSKRDLLLNLTAESIPLGGRRHLTFSDLAMRQDERIALTGPNGAGKSTLVRHLLRCPNVPATRLIYVPQEIDLTSSGQILDRARVLSGDELGRMMAVVSRLGSRPDRLLESAEPSPGETRKLLLALGIARVPHLIVMDEPTNHMDLPSIECLEEALGDCPCGLLLVSHDRRLLERLTTTRWQISRDGGEAERFVLDVQLRST